MRSWLLAQTPDHSQRADHSSLCPGGADDGWQGSGERECDGAGDQQRNPSVALPGQAGPQAAWPSCMSRAAAARIECSVMPPIALCHG